MMVAIMSDVHANLPALEQFIRLTKGIADAYVCLGDVVNYGPWNDECLELIHSLPGIVLLEGNHERLFLGLDDIEHESPLVKAFFEHSFPSFTRPDLISGLPESYELGEYICRHTIERKKIYADTEFELDRPSIIGHTHHQFQIRRSGKALANCGSLGQNRGCIDTLCYALYDTSPGTLLLRQEHHPIDGFVRELVARRYPRQCIDYYLGKRRRTKAP